MKWTSFVAAPAIVASGIAAAPIASQVVQREAAYAVVPTASTIMLNGTYAFGIEGRMQDKLQGSLCIEPYDCAEAIYNRWLLAPVSHGVKALDIAMTQIDGEIVVFGYSRGAAAAREWMEKNAGKPNAPSAEEVSFVLIGNPYRKYGGTQASMDARFQTGEYDIIDIANEYDSVADTPGKSQGTWFARLLARQNASLPQHLSYNDVDLSRPDLLVYVEQNPGGGTTTYVLVPTKNLPLLDGLRKWAPKWADKLQAKLKPLIDSAYDRSMYVPAGPSGVKLQFSDQKLSINSTVNDPEPTLTVLSSNVRQSGAQESGQSVVDETAVEGSDGDDTSPIVSTPLEVMKAEQEELVLDPGDESELEVEQVEPTEMETETMAEVESEIENEVLEKEPTEPESSGNDTSLANAGVSEAGAQSYGDDGQTPSSPNDE